MCPAALYEAAVAPAPTGSQGHTDNSILVLNSVLRSDGIPKNVCAPRSPWLADRVSASFPLEIPV